MQASVIERVASRKTDFQQIDIFDTDAFGRALLLDGHIQLTEFDEHAYHEALVQVPLLSIASPKSALVIGGGDGGVLREICRHSSIERIDIVEIDLGVIEECRLHMPSLSDGAFEDPRVTLHVRDAFPFVKKATDGYDLIVVDSTDVYEEEEGELSEMLFTDEFYRDILRLLNETGFVVTQADNLIFCPYSLEAISSLYKRIFPVVGSYQALVPSFGGFSGYCWGSKGATIVPQFPAVASELALRYLNETTYRLALSELKFS
jgi:spermidine synthase